MSTVLRLEKDGKKYWIASVKGTTAIVTFGKIGKEDKEESKKFEHASEEEAKKFITDRAVIKRDRGYKDVEIPIEKKEDKKRKRYSDGEESGEDWAELDEKIDADEVDTSLIISGSRRPKRRAAANAEVMIRNELKVNPGKDGDEDDDDDEELEL